jgi:hypothetical protein
LEMLWVLRSVGQISPMLSSIKKLPTDVGI